MNLADVQAVLTFNAGYNSALVVFATTLLGVSAGTIGSFALLRKRALMGDALAHSTLPGLVAIFISAILLGFEGKNIFVLLGGATISGVIGVLGVQFLTRHTRLSEDTAIGIVLSVFFGCGIVLLSVVQAMDISSAGGLHHFIYGQTAAMLAHDAYVITAISLLITIAAFFLIKEFRLVSFDPEFAQVQGWAVTKIDLLMMALVTLVVVVGLQAVGMILIVALLIIPAAAARFWTEKLSAMLVISAIIGGLSGYVGAAISALVPRYPAGSVIVLTAGLMFVLSFLFAPTRGLVFGILRLAKLRLQIFKDHLLRDIYETYERHSLEPGASISLNSIPLLRSKTKITTKVYFVWIHLQGLIHFAKGSVALTEHGIAEAKRLIHNHRLWEQYLIEYADAQISHVDYSADFVEHVLSPEIVEILKERIKQTDNLASVHPLK